MIRSARRGSRKYTTHAATSSKEDERKDAGGDGEKVHTDEDKGLMDAVKGAGEALGKSFGGGGK